MPFFIEYPDIVPTYNQSKSTEFCSTQCRKNTMSNNTAYQMISHPF